MYHAFQVERLVHIELAPYGYNILVCPNVAGNGKHGPHTEWFRIDSNVAIDVIKKWASVMNAQLYEKFLIDSGSLTDEADEEDQNQQHDREGTPSGQARNSTTPKKRNKRVTQRQRLKPSLKFNETVSFPLPKAFVPCDYSRHGITPTQSKSCT